jgi:regulator of protease activity HflC (stomatin/prohibitin superfamily)
LSSPKGRRRRRSRMTFGELLSVLGERLYGLWPLRVVTDWEQGVRVFSGRATRLLTSTNGFFGSGIHWFCPLLGSIVVEDVATRVVETDLQTVVTADGRQATSSLGVRFRIKDLRAVYLKVHDYEDTVLEQTRSSSGRIVASLPFAELRERLGPEVKAEVKARMRGWGIEIEEVSPVNLIAAQTLRLLQDSSGE